MQCRTDKLIHLKHFGPRNQKTNLNLSVNNLQILAASPLLHLNKKPCSFEGYDLNDSAYVAWLKINHLEVALSITSSDELSLSSEKSIPSSSSTAPVGVSSSDVLIEVLTLPPPKPPKTKRKTAVNSKAVCITDEVLQEMKTKEAKKHEAEQEITTRKLEREKKRQERELMKAKKEEQKKQKAREREEKERESSYFQVENQRKLLMYLQTYH